MNGTVVAPPLVRSANGYEPGIVDASLVKRSGSVSSAAVKSAFKFHKRSKFQVRSPILTKSSSVYGIPVAAAVQATPLKLTWVRPVPDPIMLKVTGADVPAAVVVSGCNSDETELPNAIQMSVSRDFGKHWSKPINIAKPAGKKVYWPWVTAGKAGKVSVVWYQTDKVVDLDCQSAKTSVYNATILNALSRHPTRHVVNAAGRLIHNDNVCQGGTTCVATGQDRRLGDFFTNAIDPRGCVLIASGDTTVKGLDGTERPTSLPIFMRQNSGPGLKGRSCGRSKRKHRRHRHKHKHGQGEEEHPSPAAQR